MTAFVVPLVDVCDQTRVRQEQPSVAALPGAVISGCSLALLTAHVTLRAGGVGLAEGLDPITLGLAALALSPFVARVFRSVKVGGLELTFIEQSVKAQGEEIDRIKFVLEHLVSEPELAVLAKMSENAPYLVSTAVAANAFKGELRRLRALGFIEARPGRSVEGMYLGEGTSRDVHEHFRVTEKGRRFLKMREA